MVESALDARIDELYRLPPGEFVAARHELAKHSSRDEARIVRDLDKPNVVAWALNQLYWSARPAFDRLVETAARLREAQADALLRRKHEYPRAEADHRRALADAVREAGRILEAAGHPATPDALRAITGALEALPWKERAGRLARPPSSLGFGVLAGLPAAAPSPTDDSPAAPPRTPRPSTPLRAAKPSPPPLRAAKPSSAPLRAAKPSHSTPPPARRPTADEERLRVRVQQARDALAAARTEAAAAEVRLRAGREQVARAQEAEREVRERLGEARRELAAAKDAQRAAERDDAAARVALRKAEAAARATTGRA